MGTKDRKRRKGRLSASAFRAMVAVTGYASVLILILTWPDRSEDPTAWSIALTVGTLSAAFLVAGAALLRVVFVVRRVARRQVAGEAWPEIRDTDGPGADRGWLPKIWGALILFTAAWAIVPLGARDLLSPATAWIWIVFAAAVAYRLLTAVGKAGPDEPQIPSPKSLRRLSVWISISGLAGILVNGVLVATMLLPLALAQYIPLAPNPGLRHTLPAAPTPFFQSPSGAENEQGALAGGEALHSLVYAGSIKAPARIEQIPERAYDPWWDLSEPVPLKIPPERWADDLLPALIDGRLDDTEMAFLETLRRHPAHDEFEVVANANTLRISETRWVDGLDSAMTVFEFPIPRYVELWNGVRSRIALASILAVEGASDEAEVILRGLIRLGESLERDGPSLTDPQIGARIAMEATQAQRTLRATSAEGETVEERVIQSRGSNPPPELYPEGTLGATPARKLTWIVGHRAVAQDTMAPRAYRLEGTAVTATFAPCGFPRRIVWGLPDSFETSLGTGDLGATTQEAAILRIYREGYLGTRAGLDGWGRLPHFFAVVLSTRPAVTHCLPTLAVLRNR